MYMKKNFLAGIFFFQFGLITLRLNWWILLKKIFSLSFFFLGNWVSKLWNRFMCQQLFLYSATVVAHPNSSVVCWVQRINRHILCTWQTISLIIDVLVLHPTDKPDSWAKFRSQKVMKTSSPTSKRSTENSLWGWFFVCVYFFRSENNVEYLWKWHTAQWQMPKLSTIWIAISDNYSFNTDKIPDRFMIPNSSSLSEMGKLTLTDSQTCFTSSKCDHPKTLTVWCILPPKLLVSSVKFFCLFFWEVLARITLLKWFNYNFPLKRGSLSDSKLFFGN